LINIWTYFEKFWQKISQNRAKYGVKKDLGQVLTPIPDKASSQSRLVPSPTMGDGSRSRKI